jgi:YVTN family beta-propeller protein
MDSKPLLSRISREGNFENSLAYKASDESLDRVGDFLEGTDPNVSSNKITRLSNTLVFAIQNPTAVPQTVDLFGFTNNLFLGAPVNPPPSILQPVLTPVGLGPVDAAFCPFNNFIYTADPISSTVEVIDTVTNTVFATIPTPGFFGTSIAYCPTNNQMYVGDSLGATIIRIDCATNAIVGVPIIPTVVPQTAGLTYNSVNNSMYVVGLGGPIMCEISCVTNLATPFFIVVGAAFLQRAAFSPVLNRIYVTDSITNNVFTIDCLTNLTILATVTGLVGLQSISLCSSNNSVYMLGFTSNNVIGLDTLTNILTPIIPVLANNPADICYNPINNLLYVTKLTNQVAIIDPVTNTVLSFFLSGITSTAIIVYNDISNSVGLLANGGAAGEYVAFVPIAPPSAVVTLNGGFTLTDIYRDLQGKSFLLEGVKMIVNSIDQLANNIIVSQKTITGNDELLQFQPLNYVSPTNPNALIIDAADFNIMVDRNTNVDLTINPLSSLVISFTIGRQVDNTTPLFEDISKDWGAGADVSDVVRLTGNPIVDAILEAEAQKILSDSNYTSIVQYAEYPRVTGNPVADIALLNQGL